MARWRWSRARRRRPLPASRHGAFDRRGARRRSPPAPITAAGASMLTAKVLVPGLPGVSARGEETLIWHYPVIENTIRPSGRQFVAISTATPSPNRSSLPNESGSFTRLERRIGSTTIPGRLTTATIDQCCSDPMHGPFLHGKTYTQSRGPRTDSVKVLEKDGGFEVFQRRSARREPRFGWRVLHSRSSPHYARVRNSRCRPMPGPAVSWASSSMRRRSTSRAFTRINNLQRLRWR